MIRFHRSLLIVVFVGIVSCGLACKKPKPPDNRTPAQYFKEEQVNIMTPHGKIMTDSVEERDGTIQFSTEDGKQWRVRYSKRADGTYEYDTPDEVK